MRLSPVSFFMIIQNTKRHPNNTKTDQLPISEVITGLPRPYHLEACANFDSAAWDTETQHAVLSGKYARFTQNPAMKHHL